MSVYTLGIWTVRHGHEDEFQAGWQELARRTREDFPEATALLLRDRESPNRFISIGPWKSLEQIATWRGSAAFTESVGVLRALADGFEPHTLDPVVVVE
jgi:heme-degrading monooxygenase HmoA